MVELYKQYICVYCGTTDYYKNYWIRDKSHNVKCKTCGAYMSKDLLMADMSPYEWGLWLSLNIETHRSPHNRFSEKVDYKLLKFNLNTFSAGVKKEFYDGYYYLRNNNIINTSDMLEKLNYKLGIWKKREKIKTLNDF